MLWITRKTGKPDPGMMANGMLAGLVAVTAPCAFVDPWAAAVIGSIAGVLVIEAIFFVERRLKIDDPEIAGLALPEMGLPAYSMADSTPIDAEMEELTVPSRASATLGDCRP